MQTATQPHTATAKATTASSASSSARSRRMIAVATLAFGLGLVFLAGFANSAAVHNAAHDTRHAMAFPCH